VVTQKRKAPANVKAAPRYTTRSRKPTTKVKEAAPAYSARSRQVPTKAKKRSTAPKRPSTAKKQARQGEALWQFFQTLTGDEQGAFVRRLLQDRHWYEDIYDGISINEANKEPSRPLEEYTAEYLARPGNKRPK
jgi:hypothetical protein